jgi:hypothetical protein
MKGRWSIATAVGAVALLTGLLMSATATAASQYCLNGVTLPPGAAPISATSETAGSLSVTVDAAFAEDVLGAIPSGVFYVGHVTGDSGGWWGGGWYWSNSPGGLEDGYSTNYVSLGACKAAWTPDPPRVAVCKRLARGDGTTGMFQEITLAQWNDKDGQYFDAPAANWVDGLGLTCDNPLALGYKAAGYNVAWGGKQDPANDLTGVRGSGLNDIYPYYTK